MSPTKLVNLDTLLASTGRVIEVPERSVHGCRPQVVTEVDNAATVAANGRRALKSGDAMPPLHGVVFYEDRLEDLLRVADLMGLSVRVQG